MIYQDSLLYPGIDILGSFKSGEKIELSKLLMLMLTMSDNTASLWLQALAGGGMKINPLLDSMASKIPGSIPGRLGVRRTRDLRMGTKHTAEMAGLMEKIYHGDLPLKKHSTEQMLRLLEEITGMK